MNLQSQEDHKPTFEQLFLRAKFITNMEFVRVTGMSNSVVTKLRTNQPVSKRVMRKALIALNDRLSKEQVFIELEDIDATYLD